MLRVMHVKYIITGQPNAEFETVTTMDILRLFQQY